MNKIRIERVNKELPIEVDPEIMSGQPVIKVTRVTVETLFNYLIDGVSLDKFLKCFPSVKRRHALKILEYYKDQALSQAVA